MILDLLFEKIGYVKKEDFIEVKNAREGWFDAYQRMSFERNKAIECADRKSEALKELAEENRELKERVVSLKKDYADEVLKRYELSRLVNGIEKGEKAWTE